MSTVLVTGANRGIGFQLCKQLHQRGDNVIAVCRGASDELSALGVTVISGIDVSVAQDVDRLKQTLGDKHIDVLINNAGILRGDTLHTIDFDNMMEQFRVNALGPLRVTRALLENLGDGSKVAIVSSRVGSIADNSSGNNYGYRVSKTAVNMIGTNLKHDLASHGITIALLHPGLVATDMTGGTGIPPAESAAGLIARIDQMDSENSGRFLHAEGYELPW